MREIEFRWKDDLNHAYSHWHFWDPEKDPILWLGKDEKTLGQYTGLKDKNGVKIFEGDVLRFSWMRGFHLVESFHVVRFCENAAAFKFWDGQTWSPFWGFSDEDIEVVGNIFDDPEFNERFGTPYRELK